MATKSPHTITLDGSNTMLLSLRDDDYVNTGSILGINKVTGTPPAPTYGGNEQEAINQNKLVKLSVGLAIKDGSGNVTKRSRCVLLCPFTTYANGGQTGIIGKTISRGSVTYTIVGTPRVRKHIAGYR